MHHAIWESEDIMDRINQVWPAWHTVEQIGKGAFGEVYKARRQIQDEVFYSAVKVIRIPQDEGEIKEMLSDGQTSQSIQYYYGSIAKSLMDEIRVMDMLKSAANIVNIEDFEINERENGIGWDVYIRMELLENLDTYRRHNRMDAARVAKLGADICRALEYCEKCRIIHRDIKPSNIFVDSYGNFKLGDFGIARQMEKTQGTLSRKGTEMYMAPEVRFGEKGSGYNVDIYALGLVMYRLLNNNRMPFEPLDKEMITYKDKEEAMFRRLKGDELPPPANADPGLASVILKACCADKNRRYQSASEMRADLERLRLERMTAAPDRTEKQGQSLRTAQDPTTGAVQTAAQTPVERSAGKAGKRILIASSAAAAVLLLILVIVILVPFYQRERRESLFDKAQADFAHGFYEEALDGYERAVERYPDDERGYTGAAEVYSEQGDYENALEILREGSSVCADRNGVIADQISRIEEEQGYTLQLQYAEELEEKGDYAGAEAAYQEAIGSGSAAPEAYVGLIRLYIRQDDLESAQRYLSDENTGLSADDKEQLTDLYTLQEIWHMTENSDFEKLTAYFSGDREQLGVGTYYYQDGQILDGISSGKGMILESWGVYVGEIRDNERSGEGRQFGAYSDSDTEYTVSDGTWSENMANGQCTYREFSRKDSAGDTWNWSWTGNMTDNLFDGNITVSWSRTDGSEKDTGMIHAENGTFPCIRKEGNSAYVYLEGTSTDRYWMVSSEDDLKNRGNWNSL